MAKQLPLSGYILGLDVGEKRIGAALASVIARLPQPIEMIPAGDQAYDAIHSLVQTESVSLIVVGLPRNLQGSETAQSQQIRSFAEELTRQVTVPVVYADESLSSVRADELSQHTQFKNVSQDSLAACFILEEFFGTINNDDEPQL